MLETASRLKYLVVAVVMTVLLISGLSMYRKYTNTTKVSCERTMQFTAQHNGPVDELTYDQAKCKQQPETFR